MFVSPILDEQWILDGKPCASRRCGDDALYLKPLLNKRGVVPDGMGVLHSLILDNNVFTDLIENRRPENNKFIKNILLSHQIELNPILAICEQRQKYSGATDALKKFANYIYNEFGRREALDNIDEFENSLSLHKASLTYNADSLIGYLPAIIYLYNQNWSIDDKLSCLSGMITSFDLPFFQVHFLFAALVFLMKSKPELFLDDEIRKVSSDMKIEATVTKQRTKVLNLSNDMILPISSLLSAGTVGNTLVFPYIATRDRLVQLFLSQISCGMVVQVREGITNGRWEPAPGRVLAENLGKTLADCTPKRSSETSQNDVAVRKSRLKTFSETWLEKAVASRN